MIMANTRILSGEVLVRKGALKVNSSLPETGVKDVWPNGSWLEKKQTQAALESRKQLIELERIEKSGELSHAEWREDLKLAEVTQKVGSYWQYLGHNVGKCLYLYPEEALFLMEVNCLQLNYDEVKVSLQQAYALLLPNEELLMLYKVYASLSRQGYRVYRYQTKVDAPDSAPEEKLNLIINSKENGDRIIHIDENASKNDNESVDKVDNSINIDSAAQDISMQENWVKNVNINNSKTFKYIEHGIHKLLNRKYKAFKPNILKDALENIPELYKDLVVNVVAPEEQYLPENIKLSKSAYLLNKEKILKKPTIPEEIPPIPPTPRASIEPMNTAQVKHFRNLTPNFPRCSVWGDSINIRMATQTNHFRHFNIWRAPQNFGFFHLNMTFQRQIQNVPQLGTRMIFNRLLQPFLGPNNNGSVNNNNGGMNSARGQKRTRRQTKRDHLNSIERLATHIKNSILESRFSNFNVSRLKYLIQTYNTAYKTRLRVSDDFNVIVDENVIDTIDVDDEDEPTPKRTARNDDPEAFDDKLQRLKQLASQFKNLKGETTSRHKRTITKLIKTFNNYYDTDYYLNNNFDVINGNDLTVISSSSDTEPEEEVSFKPEFKRKLKNPFSILKQLSEKQTDEPLCEPSTSKKVIVCKPYFRYNNNLPQTFKDWLPDVEDFGRPEIISKKVAKEVIDIKKEEFLFDFMRLQPDKYDNWYDLKLSFLRSLKETSELFHCEAQNKTYLNSLVKQEDFTDTASVLKKLSIIKSHKTASGDSNLTINFDVYNRDVQNFRKSNRPLPHFRVVCLRESSVLPCGADVAKLHSQYKDYVCIIFAVVGSGSISYLQINPVDIPIYISNNSNTA